MNPDVLIRGVLGSVLGGGRKRSGRALRYLTGQKGSLWTRPTTLLTAAGVAWGIYETLQQQSSSGGAGPSVSGAPPPPPAGPLPPLPGSDRAPDADALRLVRLAVSAASADGVMNEKERAAVVQHAHAAGVGDIVERELNHRRPLAEIVAGIDDPAQRATLYVLAFTVLRADEQITGAERIYLAQLAHLLQLDPGRVQQLEKDTSDRIDNL